MKGIGPKPIRSILLTVVLGLAFLRLVGAQAQLVISGSVLGNGGAEVGNDAYRIVGTVGQPAIGAVSSPSHTHQVGFWFTADVNNPPEVANAILDQSLTAGGPPYTRDLNAAPPVFTDADKDALTYTAASSSESVATASMSGNRLTVAPKAEGVATITVTAEDGKGGKRSTTFKVTVNLTQTGGPPGGKQVSVGNVTGSPGGTVTVPISVGDAKGIAGATLTLSFDANVLIPRKIEGSPLLTGAGVTPTSNLNFGPGQVRATWAGTTGIASGGGELVKVTFEVKPTAPNGTTTPLTLQAILRNEGGITIPSTVTAGSVAIRVGVWGDVNKDGAADAGDAILILRFEAGLKPLTDDQKNLGDVNADGSTDAGDAILILRFEAGLIKKFPREGASKLAVGVREQEGMGKGVKLGEVKMTNTYSALSAQPSSPLEVPLILEAGVYGGSLTLTYDAGAYEGAEVKGPEGVLVITRSDESGEVRVSVARAEAEERVSLTVVLRAGGGRQTADSRDFTLPRDRTDFWR